MRFLPQYPHPMTATLVIKPPRPHNRRPPSLRNIGIPPECWLLPVPTRLANPGMLRRMNHIGSLHLLQERVASAESGASFTAPNLVPCAARDTVHPIAPE